MKKEISEICLNFNLGDILSFDVVKEGVLNENYIINTSRGKFFLKYCKNKSAEEIKYIWKIEQFMRNTAIPAIEAMYVDEEQGWMVYPFIESDRSHSYNLQDYFVMGQNLGRIHNVSYDVQIPEFLKEANYVDSSERFTAVERMKGHAQRISQKETIDEIDTLFLLYINKKLTYTKKFDNIVLPVNDTLVHGDFHPGNLLIDEKSRSVIGICDWEKAQYAPRSYDVARSYLYIGFGTNVDDVDECLEISEKFLSGYRSVIQISDTEFKKGLLMRLRNNVFTTWIEDKYYSNNDSRANKFLKNSMLTLDYFLGEQNQQA